MLQFQKCCFTIKKIFICAVQCKLFAQQGVVTPYPSPPLNSLLHHPAKHSIIVLYTPKPNSVPIPLITDMWQYNDSFVYTD